MGLRNQILNQETIQLLTQYHSKTLTSPQSNRPRMTSPQSTRPLIQGDVSHKLPVHGRISASIWSETELNVNTPH